MKHITITRAWADERVTLGMLKVAGESHNPIFTLENPKRASKEDSCIPCGFYTCVPHNSAKYPGTYEVISVPNRTGILIHWGNTEVDTNGCILVGLELGNMGINPAVLHSHDGLRYLRSLIGEGQFSLELRD